MRDFFRLIGWIGVVLFAGTNDLDDILCWREQRSVARQLVVNYNRMKFMLRPDKTSAAVAGKLVDIYDFPDGRLEIRWKALPLPSSVFDQLQRVSQPESRPDEGPR